MPTRSSKESIYLLGVFWSEWQDLNLRPPRPERGALPDCATLRLEAGLITPAPLNASLRKAMTAQPGTRVLKADRDAIEAAARCLAAGGLVAFATETVYGVGADAGMARPSRGCMQPKVVPHSIP